MAKTLIRTDRNGTKYFEEEVACMKCGGHGYLGYFHSIENGICFDCNGSGKLIEKTKEYTPEYAVKMQAKAEAKAAKYAAEFEARQAEKAAAIRSKHADENGVCWYVLGNTFEIRDRIKEAGGIFEPVNGWHFSKKIEGFDLQPVNFADLYDGSTFLILIPIRFI